MKPGFHYPAIVIRAMEAATAWHEGQWRKDPAKKIPYISHPVGVGYLLMLAGFGEEVVAAGVLHDVIEDCGVTERELAHEFNPRIAKMVSEVSESKKYSWDKRKKMYRERLKTASRGALAIACADHIHNLRSLVKSLKVDKNIWRMFHATREEKIHNEREVLKIIAKRLRSPLVAEYEKVFAKL